MPPPEWRDHLAPRLILSTATHRAESHQPIVQRDNAGYEEDESVRVMRIGPQSFEVSAVHEEEWASLASEPTRAARVGERPVPTVWFRTDTGAVGSLPVSDRFPVRFIDEDDPVGFVGTVTLLGPEAGPPAPTTTQ